MGVLAFIATVFVLWVASLYELAPALAGLFFVISLLLSFFCLNLAWSSEYSETGLLARGPGTPCGNPVYYIVIKPVVRLLLGFSSTALTIHFLDQMSDCVFHGYSQLGAGALQDLTYKFGAYLDWLNVVNSLKERSGLTLRFTALAQGWMFGALSVDLLIQIGVSIRAVTALLDATRCKSGPYCELPAGDGVKARL